MTVTSRISMDLQKPNAASMVQCVQNDRYCRYVEVEMFSGGDPWDVPEDASVIVSYIKPDGKTGMYDALPDGSRAYVIRGNVVTVGLAPQVLTVAGVTGVMMTLICGEKYLSTFAFRVNVSRALEIEPFVSDDYYHITGFLPAPGNARVGQYLAVGAVNDLGRVADVQAMDAPIGGYYTLEVTQPEENQIQLAFVPSNPDMPALQPQIITLPGGGTVGVTPHIGANGNWYVGEEDTGVKASGTDGKDGQPGTDGQDGYTPVKGVDYFDGAPGKDGKDGEPGTDGYTPVKGVDYFDGVPGQDGADGYTPVKGIDYYTDAEKTEFETFIATELAKRGQLKPEFANSIAGCTDTSKMYVLPDGYIYAYILTETVVGGAANYKNQIPMSVNTDGSAYVGANGEDGYKTGYRLNSSGAEQAQSGMCCTGFIPVKAGDKVRIKNVNLTGTKSPYLLFYSGSGTCLTTLTQYPENTSADSDGVRTYTVGSGNAELKYMRLSAGVIDDTTIITLNEEIKETGDTVVTDYAWASTGHAFVPADYEDRIVALENKVNIAGGDQIELIRNWDAPIYDDAPVFLMSQDKSAMGTQSVAAVYALYDALMAAHPRYITRTDLGLASDGKTHIYRYDFCEPRTRKNPESSNHPDLVKPKAIIVSGIHLEYAGIYGLYYALEEIANNPELYHDLRNNTHLIVVPCMNPYCLDSANYNASNGRKNANGVEIHRNFEIDHKVVDASSNNYGGAAPLSEVESQYVDAIMAENPDAAFFLTCHNFDSDTYFGSGFIWPSVATRYMYNMGSRLIDKMSRAWLDKYGDTFKNGVDAVKTSSVAEGDYTVGMVGISGSPGTETKQAMKYGIQGTNVEIAKVFKVFNSTVGSREVMSRGAEVYVNFMRMAFGAWKKYKLGE